MVLIRHAAWLLAPIAALPLLAAAGSPATAPVARPAAFARCASCHAAAKGAGGDVGPNLYGVIGTRAGTRPGYDYSAALKASGVVWTPATVVAYIANPQAVARGTQMPDTGVSKPADREAIAAWLATLH